MTVNDLNSIWLKRTTVKTYDFTLVSKSILGNTSCTFWETKFRQKFAEAKEQ